MGNSFLRYQGYGDKRETAINSSINTIKKYGYVIEQRYSLDEVGSTVFICIKGYGWYTYYTEKQEDTFVAIPKYYGPIDDSILALFKKDKILSVK